MIYSSYYIYQHTLLETLKMLGYLYKILLKVAKHKTHDYYSKAHVFLSKEGEELLDIYMRDLRPHTPYYMPTSDVDEPVFLTEKGRAITDFGSHIAGVWSAKGYDRRFLPQHMRETAAVAVSILVYCKYQVVYFTFHITYFFKLVKTNKYFFVTKTSM